MKIYDANEGGLGGKEGGWRESRKEGGRLREKEVGRKLVRKETLKWNSRKKSDAGRRMRRECEGEWKA